MNDAAKTLSLVIFVTFTTALAVVLVNSKRAYDHEVAQLAAWRAVLVEPPEGRPTLSQRSIDTALAIYGIEIPDSAFYPTYNQKLADRGMSMREPWSRKIKVQVGPSAFASWGLLGSTLAHELEIHCQQNFLFINLLDALALDGTGEAERQAYEHEMRHAARFGLLDADVKLIAATKDYYYPSKPSGSRLAGQVSQTIGQWLAKNLVVTR